VSATADELVAQARQRIARIGPAELEPLAAAGGLIVDIRPVAQRAEEGELPGALIIERNVLEWRLDPSSAFRIPEAASHQRFVLVLCQQGYASSLAAASLKELGYARAGDVIGGFDAWREAGLPVAIET
jgi:rhodanese-related sulfurtransferase